MSERVDQHLESESDSGSRGYVTDRPVRYELTATVLTSADGVEPTRRITDRADVDVPPLSGLPDLLRIARSEHR